MDPAESDLSFVLLGGSLIALFLTISVVLFVFLYQRRVMRQHLRLQVIESEHQIDLMRSMLETQENERRRIAKDLHDDIGAVLSAAKLNLDLLARRAGREEVEPEQLKEVGQVVSGAIGDLRRISHDLMPPALEAEGLEVALQVFLHKIEVATGIKTRFSFLAGREKGGLSAGNPEVNSGQRLGSTLKEFGLGREKSLSVYRMVQELTNNSLKHSGCKHIACRLQATRDFVWVEYEDDGKGFNVELARIARSSLGLKSLESRIRAMGGNWEAYSQPGAGMQVTIRIPIQKYPEPLKSGWGNLFNEDEC